MLDLDKEKVMKTQKSSRFRKLAFIIVALAGMGVVVNGIVSADAFGTVQKPKTPVVTTVAQNTIETTESQEKTSPSESQPSESEAEEKKESSAPPKKSFKKFRPSERIEAEQAVDFPYDI